MFIASDQRAGAAYIKRNLSIRAAPNLILVAGPTCSGKSEFSQKLNILLTPVSLISLDDHFKDRDDPSLPQISGRKTFDAPDSYVISEYRENVARLMAGEDICCPIYDMATNLRGKVSKKIEASGIIVVDGLYAIRELGRFYPKAFKVYVDAVETVRLSRRIKRNREKFGISENATRRNFYEKVMPMERQYVESQRDQADIIVISN